MPTQPLPLPLLNRTEGRDKMKKLMGQDKNRKNTLQLPSMPKQVQLKKDYYQLKIELDSEKQNQN